MSVTDKQFAMLQRIATHPTGATPGSLPVSMEQVAFVQLDLVLENARSDRATIMSLINKALIEKQTNEEGVPFVILTPASLAELNQPVGGDELVVDVAAQLAAQQAKAPKVIKAKAVKTPEVERPVQNGIKMPKPDTSAGRIWNLASSLSTYYNRPVTSEEIIKMAEDHNSGSNLVNLSGWENWQVNIGNVRIEYSMWRKFYGIPAQAKAPKEAAPVVAKAAKPTKAVKVTAPVAPVAPVAPALPAFLQQ